MPIHTQGCQNSTLQAISTTLLGSAYATLVKQHACSHLPLTSLEGALWPSHFSIFQRLPIFTLVDGNKLQYLENHLGAN